MENNLRYSSAFYAEIFRAGIQSIKKGQLDAAKAVGITSLLAFRRIVMPQAFRRTLPPFIGQCILVLKIRRCVLCWLFRKYSMRVNLSVWTHLGRWRYSQLSQ